MTLFTCEFCTYSTKKQGNYLRHVQTNKHKKNAHKVKHIKNDAAATPLPKHVRDAKKPKNLEQLKKHVKILVHMVLII